MHSLSRKLTLAFLFIGLTVALLVAMFVRQQTQQQFDQFVLDRYQLELLDELAAYYENYGSWENISAVLLPSRDGPYDNHHNWQPVTLADTGQRVIAGNKTHPTGHRLSAEEMKTAVAIKVNTKTVGWVVFPLPEDRQDIGPDSPEAQFMAGVNQAILYSAVGATIIALILGVLLARTISHPVRELTAATQLVAQGKFGHQVTIHSHDELSELSHAFNQMSADLSRARQVRQQMTADIAHDLRTPTSVILGYAEALNDGHLQGTPDIYRVLYQEAGHLNRLINDLRLLSLADTGELPLNRQPMPPDDLLRRVALAFQTQAEEKGVQVIMSPATWLPPVYVDPERMNQVLGNLVSNALRYTPAGGQITLAAQKQESDQTVAFTVQDTGRGIAPEDIPFIFNRFYRGDAARQTTGESGLGLAIARSITLAHDGQIRVESTLGVGSTFYVTLPIFNDDLHNLPTTS